MAWNADIPALTNTIAADVPKIELNFQCLNDRFAYGTIWIPAGAMIPLSTNGAEYGITEKATNDIMLEYYAFDATTEEYVAVNLVMPEDYALGTLKAKFFWSSAAGSTAADTVEWQIAGRTFADDAGLDAAVGTPQVISDALLANAGADLQVSGATPATTITGTPALNEFMHIKFSRNVGGTDDMTEDAWLFGVLIQYGRTNAAVTAW